MRQRRTKSSSLWKRTSVVVAIVTALGAIAVALTDGVGNWLARSDNDRAQYLRLLELRADRIAVWLDSTGQDATKAQFLELHHQHLDAVRAGQNIVAHELTTRIRELLKPVPTRVTREDGSVTTFIAPPSDVDTFYFTGTVTDTLHLAVPLSYPNEQRK